jgi:hypothetical protein
LQTGDPIRRLTQHGRVRGGCSGLDCKVKQEATLGGTIPVLVEAGLD